MMNFKDIKKDDTVTRLLGGVLPMELIVTSVDDDFIYCGEVGGWKFDRNTGMEIDEDLGWDNIKSRSYLKK